MKLVKYRIVRDDYKGFEVQVWRIWMPFWFQFRFCNTHPTIEHAEEFIRNPSRIVKEID